MSTQKPSGARTAGLFRLTAACAGLLVALSGCSTGKPPSAASDAPSAPTSAAAADGQTNPDTANAQAFPAVKLDSATLFQIIAADIAAQRGQPATACLPCRQRPKRLCKKNGTHGKTRFLNHLRLPTEVLSQGNAAQKNGPSRGRTVQSKVTG